jgi:NitT/TauT family transport system substrate-binding protein
MRNLFARAAHAFAVAAMVGVLFVSATSAQAEKLRIALAEPPSDELAHIFVALDRAKKNGLEYEWTAFADEGPRLPTRSSRFRRS